MKTLSTLNRLAARFFPQSARILLLTAFLVVGTIACAHNADTTVVAPAFPLETQETQIELPEPRVDGDVSLEQCLIKRRSVRDYSGKPLALAEVSQLLWAAQGITADRGYRTAPSAGALYPLEVYVIAGNVEDLTAGIYRYNPQKHELIMTAAGDIRAQLSSAALEQTAVKDGAIGLVFTAVYQRTTKKYGDRGIRYVHMETGHAAQNVCLQAAAMGLGVVTIGAFHDDQISTLLNLPEDEVPLYIIPVGRRR